jgi:site-specific recombinase XerD
VIYLDYDAWLWRIHICTERPMLRHATGYKLANDGVATRSLQAYLGHKCIRHITRYSKMSGR